MTSCGALGWGRGAFSARLRPHAIGWIDLERLRKDTPPLSGMTWSSPCRGGRCAGPPPRAEPLGCTLVLPSASSRITRGGTPSRASGCSWFDEQEIQRRSSGGECRAIGLRRLDKRFRLLECELSSWSVTDSVSSTVLAELVSRNKRTQCFARVY